MWCYEYKYYKKFLNYYFLNDINVSKIKELMKLQKNT